MCQPVQSAAHCSETKAILPTGDAPYDRVMTLGTGQELLSGRPHAEPRCPASILHAQRPGAASRCLVVSILAVAGPCDKCDADSLVAAMPCRTAALYPQPTPRCRRSPPSRQWWHGWPACALRHTRSPRCHHALGLEGAGFCTQGKPQHPTTRRSQPSVASAPGRHSQAATPRVPNRIPQSRNHMENSTCLRRSAAAHRPDLPYRKSRPVESQQPSASPLWQFLTTLTC